jgi:phosphoglycerol transferase
MKISFSSIAKTIKLYRLKPFFLIFLFFFLYKGLRFWHRFFNDYTLDDLIIYLNLPTEGVDKSLERCFIDRCLLNPLLWSLGICYIPELITLILPVVNFIKKHYAKIVTYGFGAALIVLIGKQNISLNDITHFFYRPTSNFYEKYFHRPTADNITLPKKKNLLLVQLESIEQTFENKNFFENSLLPNLQRLEPLGVSFEHYHNGYSTSYTQGSLIAMYTGVPTNYISGRIMNLSGDNFRLLPEYYTLSQILRDNGYKTTFIQGSDKAFSGTGKFLENHGVERIIDRSSIAVLYPDLRIAGDWGYGDDDVFDIVLTELDRLDSKQPWMMHIKTVDTHFAYDPEVIRGRDTSSFQVIRHTDQALYDFITKFQKHPDYKNTLIVLLGDHLRMGQDFETPQHRDIYNLFIHAPSAINTDRTLTQIDLFPTILEAMGADIQGHRLGLGTSVFSNKQTLAERFSEDELKIELSKNNRLYNSLWE